MGYTIYRLAVDENDREDITDYSHILDAEKAFMAATRRKTVYAAQVYSYDAETDHCIGRVYNYDRD
jgi:hypothetical protein